MDQTHFDAMTRTLASLPSRRGVLRGLVAAGLGLGALRMADAVAGKQKRRKNYARKRGHRQGFTEVRINDISLG